MKRTLERTNHETGEKIKATLTTEGGYWSVTGEIKEKGAREAHTFGCIHDEISAVFPSLRPFIALHLANVDTGLPLHSLANGKWFVEHVAGVSYDDHTYTLETIKNHWRIGGLEAKYLVDTCKELLGEIKVYDIKKGHLWSERFDQWNEYIKNWEMGQHERFKNESTAALEAAKGVLI